jgi:hypothetical protein
MNCQKFGDCGGTKVLLDVLQKWASSEKKIVTACWRAIRALAQNSANKNMLLHGNAGKCIVESLRIWNSEQHSDSLINGCLTLRELASSRYDSPNRMLLCNTGACEILVEILRNFIEHANVVEAALQGLWMLALGYDESKLAMGRAKSCELLLEVLRRWRIKERISRYGCAVVWTLSSNDENLARFKLLDDASKVIGDVAVNIWQDRVLDMLQSEMKV